MTKAELIAILTQVEDYDPDYEISTAYEDQFRLYIGECHGVKHPQIKKDLDGYYIDLINTTL